ncbi:unnamed protein product [Cuscuta epithymum]|uniref:AB hydrolase-1 domain-containing protein n=1 Tax=Cuscuta epithymum TaxID=186058 RepID=A0AAV0D3D2_9ASTE|nr:unnamed protein product [Cuscuta epithymum]
MTSGAMWGFERLRRGVKILYFMVAMVASLLVISSPVLVAMGDMIVQCVLISCFTCISGYSFQEHLHIYTFKSSLTDIPLVSIIRSLVITCVYSLCNGASLSHETYLGAVTFCSVISVLLLSIKACVFSVNSYLEAEASISISRQKFHLMKSWGMPVLFLSSVVFALGHSVIAYRSSCRARRKLLFHRIDPDAVRAKVVFPGYQKVPRSPIPSAGKAPRSDNGLRTKSARFAHVDGQLPVRLLADSDSLFISCLGLAIHYKISLPGSPPCSFSSMAFFDRSAVSGSSRNEQKLRRSFSNQYNSSSLSIPLLDTSPKSPVMFEDIPVLSLSETRCEDNQINNLPYPPNMRDLEANHEHGIVLVHGFGGGVFSWRNVMVMLAQQVGCTVVAFDRPGWGLTSRPCRRDWEEKQLPNPYKIDSQVDLLLSFCLEMGFSSVILVGHDDGGLLALKAAQRVQSSMGSINVIIKGVVLLSVSLTRELVPGFARILLRTSLGKKHLVGPLLRTEITQVVNRHAWYDATKLTTEVLSLYKAPLFVEGWDEALHEIGKLSFETVLSPGNAISVLKAVENIPVLVVAGAEDALVPLKSVQIMVSKFVNSRLVAISGCGHLPHEECPKALLAAMSPFISRILEAPES